MNSAAYDAALRQRGGLTIWFPGSHSGAGRHGVLSHTVNGFALAAIRVNGIDCAEATLLMPVAERLGPRTVAFAVTEVADVLGWINAVSVLAASLR